MSPAPILQREAAADRLRGATRDAHDAVEHALDWERRTASREAYRGWLAALHGFHRGWEPAVAAAIGDPAFLAPRFKLELLEADLRALGGMAGGAAGRVPAWRDTLVLGDRAAAWGSLYVLEGSMLGGRIVARRVAATLGHASRYHAAYGAETGAMWRDVRARLERELVDEGARDRAAEAARATFAALGSWLAVDFAR